MANEIILNFTGGINDSLDPDRLQKDEIEDALNMRANDTGNAVSREGTSVEVADDASTFPNGLSSEFEATLSDGTVRTIATSWSGSDVQFWFKDGSAWSELSTSAALDTEIGTNGDEKRFRWVFFNDLFIAVKRGGMLPVKWDGNTGNAVEILDTESATSGLGDGTKRPIDVAVWNRRLAMCQETELYISDAEQAEEWDNGDSFVTKFKGTSYGEETINAIYTFQKDLYVFKKDSAIWVLQPEAGNSTSFIIEEVASNIGCSAPFSIQNLGRDLIFFHSSGFNLLSDLRDKGGKAPNGRLSQKISRTIVSQINPDEHENISSVYDPDLAEYLVSVPVGTSQVEHNRVLVLNVEWTRKRSEASWWKYEYASNLKGLFYRASGGTRRIGASTYDGGLEKLNSTTTDGASTGFTKLLKTRRFPLGIPQALKLLGFLYIDLFQGSSFDVTIKGFLNEGKRVKSFSVNVVKSSSAWDDAVWDDPEALWGQALRGLQKKFFGKTSRDVQFEIFTTANADTLSVNKLLLEYEALDSDIQANLSS